MDLENLQMALTVIIQVLLIVLIVGFIMFVGVGIVVLNKLKAQVANLGQGWQKVFSLPLALRGEVGEFLKYKVGNIASTELAAFIRKVRS